MAKEQGVWTVTITIPSGDDGDLIRIMEVIQSQGALVWEVYQQVTPPHVLAAFPAMDPDILCLALAGDLESVRGAQVTVRPARHLDWDDTWEGHVRPVAVGPLWLVPTGHAAPRGAPVVRMADLGAFGSGMHPSTRLCLEWLVAAPGVDHLLDVGTGTGVLALAALRLGTQQATGTELDAAALASAQANARANGLSLRLRLVALPPHALGRVFPRVVANILAAPLVDLAPRLVRAVGSGGTLLLSGVRRAQVGQVAHAYARCGMRVLPAHFIGEWALLEMLAGW